MNDLSSHEGPVENIFNFIQNLLGVLCITINFVELGLYTPGFEIDFSTEFMMGHSSGAHITTNYMKLGCHNVKGMILISPVDGVDPFGLIEGKICLPYLLTQS